VSRWNGSEDHAPSVAYARSSAAMLRNGSLASAKCRISLDVGSSTVGVVYCANPAAADGVEIPETT
jgi:hypothetical protein